MLKIATVFSGIDAPEQALKRLGIDYKIVLRATMESEQLI